MSISMIKLMMMGVLAFSFAAAPVFAVDDADDDETAEEAPKKSKKKAKKSKKKEQAPVRMVVSINKFDNKSEVNSKEIDLIRSRVQQCVVGTRKFEVVEREQLKAVMSEQNLAAAGHTDTEDVNAPEAGKMKAAAYVIYGNVLYCGVDKAGSAHNGVSSAISKYKVELQIKITNGETGRLVTEKSVTGFGIDRQISTQDLKTSFSAHGMRDAVDEACHMAVDVLRDVAYPAKVVKVAKKGLILNMTNEEVKEGDVFDLIEADEMSVDPDTGASLGYDGDDIGRVEITRVGPQTSYAKPTKKSKIDLDEDIDLDEHVYIVRRVSKATLLKERKEGKDAIQNNFEDRF